MGVKEGYKQTEVGIIPGVWKVERFSDICELINGRGFKPYEWRLEGLPIIRIQNLNGSDDFNYYQGPFDQKILVQNHQLLFAWSGSRGTSFGPHIWKGGDALLNYHTWKLRIKSSELDHSFFLHKLREITKQIEEEAHGASALVHTQKGEVEAFILSLPPLPEQKAIAAALSDTDELIGGLEALVAKKRDIKQGAMQQLLTGRKRLPGFTGEWEEKRLGDLGDCIRGVTYKPELDLLSYETENSIKLLRSNNVQQSSVVFEDCQILRKEKISDKQIMQDGDILICMSNGSKELVGKCGVFRNQSNSLYAFGAFMGVFRTFNLDSNYVFYILNTFRFRRYINDILAGSSINNIRPGDIQDVTFDAPSFEEQQAIAALLSDMDAEIESLQTQLGKTRALKQGMMQELLTGRIRLVESVKGAE